LLVVLVCLRLTNSGFVKKLIRLTLKNLLFVFKTKMENDSQLKSQWRVAVGGGKIQKKTTS
jgi:hypothetical protein